MKKGIKMEIKKAAIFGDLHLDVNHFGIDRLKEQEEMLWYCRRKIIEHDVDTVIITGDIYHTNRPTARAINLMSKFLISLVNEQIHVCIICGNHDYHNSSFSAIIPLQHIDRDYVHIFDVDIEKGLADGVRSIGDWTFIPYSKYDQQAIISKVKTKYAVGHITADGALHGAENFMISNVVRSVSTFPENLEILFSGHIHKKQEIIKNKTRVIYSGSLIRNDFGEMNDEKSMVIFDTVENEIIYENIPCANMVHISGNMNDIQIDTDAISGSIVKLTVDKWDQSITREQYEKMLIEAGAMYVYAIFLNKKKTTGEVKANGGSVEMLSVDDAIKEWYEENDHTGLIGIAREYMDGVCDEN